MEKCNKHYEAKEWIVEKQQSVEDNIYIKNYSKQDLYFYILLNPNQKYRIGIISPKYLYLNQKINGVELEFINGDLGENVNYELLNDEFNEMYIQIHKKKTKKTKSIVPKNVFFQSFLKDGEWLSMNKWKVHTKKFAVFKHNWERQYLKDLNIKSPLKKIDKDLYNGAIVDERIKKIVKTQFFHIEESEQMYQNSHSIVMSNGGTGKSSLIGTSGTNLDETSNAGIYGYYSTNKDNWNSGIVSQTKKSIIVDELNELIAKQKGSNDGILSTLNKPLENGSYYYGKAGGKNIKFANQFIFLANVTPSFYFENLLNGMSTNVQTFGRRLSYIVYDDTMKFQSGDERVAEPTELMNVVSKDLTKIYKFLITKKKVRNGLLNRDEIKILINTYKQKFLNRIRGCEFEATKQVLTSFINTSLENRLLCFAIKVVLYDNYELIIGCDDLNKFQFSTIIDKVPRYFEDLLKDIEISIKNIMNHLENYEIKDTTAELTKKEVDKLTKYQKELLEKLHLLDSEIPFIKKYYSEIKDKGETRYYINNIKRYNSLDKQNVTFNHYGVSFNMDKNQEIFFTITNRNLFLKYRDTILDIENIDVPKTKFKQNSEVDEIDMTDIN